MSPKVNNPDPWYNAIDKPISPLFAEDVDMTMQISKIYRIGGPYPDGMNWNEYQIVP